VRAKDKPNDKNGVSGNRRQILCGTGGVETQSNKSKKIVRGRVWGESQPRTLLAILLLLRLGTGRRPVELLFSNSSSRFGGRKQGWLGTGLGDRMAHRAFRIVGHKMAELPRCAPDPVVHPGVVVVLMAGAHASAMCKVTSIAVSCSPTSLTAVPGAAPVAAGAVRG